MTYLAKTFRRQNKEWVLKTARKKGQVTYKGRPARMAPFSSMPGSKSIPTDGMWI